MTAKMSWHRIALSRHEYESGELHILLGAFHAVYIAKNGPEGMGMFGRWSEEGTRYFVYVTPKSVRYVLPLLDAYSAKRTEIPDRSGLTLIYGDELSRSYFSAEFEA